jgi:hypothetical protein
MDVYSPPGFAFDTTLPAVVVINGFAAVGETEMVRPDDFDPELKAVSDPIVERALAFIWDA